MAKNTTKLDFNFFKAISLFFSSGFILHAFQVAGFNYYHSYMITTGFVDKYFQITWEDSYYWAYEATRTIVLVFFDKIDIEKILIFSASLVGLILFISVLIFIRPPKFIRKNTRLKYFFINFKEGKLYLFFKRAGIAIAVSVASIYIIFFLVICILFWYLYPITASNIGKHQALRNMELFHENLCNGEIWDNCITIPYLDKNEIKQNAYGRVIQIQDGRVAMYTKDGPISLHLPENFVHKTLPLGDLTHNRLKVH